MFNLDDGLVFDALHDTRSGCTTTDIAALDQNYFDISQGWGDGGRVGLRHGTRHAVASTNPI
jgi:hypothetical protein